MSTGNSDDLLNLVDENSFASITVSLKIQNATTRTEFRAEPVSELAEINGHELVVTAPERCCASNHNLVLDLEVKPISGASVRVTTTAKVIGIEPIEGKRERLTLSMMQFHAEAWNQFLSVFEARQTEIEVFLKAARGY